MHVSFQEFPLFQKLFCGSSCACRLGTIDIFLDYCEEIVMLLRRNCNARSLLQLQYEFLWPSQDKGLTFVHLSLDHADGCGQYPANHYESYRENWTPFLPDAMRIRLLFRGRGGKFRRCLFMTYMKLTSTETSWNFDYRPEESHLVKPVLFLIKLDSWTQFYRWRKFFSVTY